MFFFPLPGLELRGPGMLEPSRRVWGSLWTCTGVIVLTRSTRDGSGNTEEMGGRGGGQRKASDCVLWGRSGRGDGGNANRLRSPQASRDLGLKRGGLDGRRHRASRGPGWVGLIGDLDPAMTKEGRKDHQTRNASVTLLNVCGDLQPCCINTGQNLEHNKWQTR